MGLWAGEKRVESPPHSGDGKVDWHSHVGLHFLASDVCAVRFFWGVEVEMYQSFSSWAWLKLGLWAELEVSL